MIEQEGKIYYGLRLDNEQLQADTQKAMNMFKAMGDSSVAEGARIDSAYKKAFVNIEKYGISSQSELEEAIRAQKDALKELERQYGMVNAAYYKMKVPDNLDDDFVAQRRKAHKLIGDTKIELDRERFTLTQLEDAYTKLKKAQEESNNKRDPEKITAYRTQIAQLTNEMARLEGQGLRESEMYKELQQQLTDVGTAYNRAQKEKRMLTTGGSAQEGILSGMTGIAGAFTAAQGVMSIFIESNERLASVQTKLQSAMAITMGLQQVSNTLHATSAFRIHTVTRVTQLWNAAQRLLNVQLGISTVLSKALMAGGIGLLIAGVAALGYGIYKLVSGQTEAAKAQKRLNEATDDYNRSAETEKVNIDILFDRLKKAEKGTDAYQKAKDNIISKYGSYLSGLNDEIRSLNDVAGAYRAISEAAIQAAKDRAIEKGADEAMKTYTTAWGENIKKIREKFVGKFDEAQVTLLMDSLKDSLSSGGRLTQEVEDAIREFDAILFQSMGNYGGVKSSESNQNMVDVYIGRIRSAKKTMDDEIAELEDVFGKIGKPGKEAAKGFIDVNKEIADTTSRISELKQAIADLRSGKTKVDAEKSLKDEIESKENELKETERKLSVLTGRNEKDEEKDKKGANRRKSETADRLAAIKEAQEKVKSQEHDFELEMQQEIINLMDEGSQKVLLQIDLDYEKRMAEVAKKGTELIKQQQDIERKIWENENPNRKEQGLSFAPTTTNVDQLPEDQKRYLENQATFAFEVKRKALEDQKNQERLSRTEYLKEYGDHFQKIAAINEAYAKRMAEESDQWKKKSLQAEWKKELADAHEYLIGMLDLDRDVTKARMDGAADSYFFEADRREANLKAEKAYTEERIRLLEEQYAVDPTERLERAIKMSRVELEKTNRELEKIPAQKLSEAAGYFSKIAGALGGLDGSLGDVFSAMSDSFESMSEVINSDMSTGAGKMNAYASAIEGVVSLINLATSASKRRNEVEREFYKNQIALAHEYAIAMNEQLRVQSEMSGSGFVRDYAGEIEDGFSALSDATAKYQEAIGKLSEGKAKVDLRNTVDWDKVGQGAAKGAAAGTALGTTILPGIGTAIGAVVGGLVGGLVGLFGGKKKKVVEDSLLAVFPELVDATGNLNKELAQTLINTDQVDEKTKQLVRNALDWADAVEAAEEQIKDITTDLAGDLGNDIKNSLMEAFKAGEDASKKMFKAAGDSLGKFVEDLLYSTVFSDVFENFGKELAASLKPGSGDMDVVDDYDRLMDALDGLDNLYLSLLKSVQERAKGRGFDIWEAEEKEEGRKASPKGVESLNQDSVNELNGRFTALQALTYEINNNVKLLASNSQSILLVVTGIKNDTKHLERLENIEKNTKAAKDGISDMNLKGVTIKQ